MLSALMTLGKAGNLAQCGEWSSCVCKIAVLKQLAITEILHVINVPAWLN